MEGGIESWRGRSVVCSVQFTDILPSPESSEMLKKTRTDNQEPSS